ncbi:uncharacterized protein Ecym_8167 [Eremothecium cymbalariae DBVPG|uniref:Abscisic acid G-protein coupled receptor-like domain-containing protein n=1 Tax=Eremothecium cymbalariae (strain CBS 270.75 / DBVPG 7215 / KCTC 17166 / NRRL Y-17582) TaxID=931890 RepID=G8JX79_ERECY|nr:Hypothetical protein Ecym_8167 [Eremothecium cymbalariae DBVPG\
MLELQRDSRRTIKMEELFMLLFICVTAVIVYNQSYRFLWYKLEKLFELTPISLNASEPDPTLITLQKRKSKMVVLKPYIEYLGSFSSISNIIRVIVSATFALCVVAVEIVLWQIKTAESQQAGDIITEVIWPITSMLLSASLIMIQPLCILIIFVYKFLERSRDISEVVFLGSLCTILCVVLLASVNCGPFYYTRNLLTRLSIVGVTMMGALSGIASISTPYYVTMYFLKNKETTVLNNAYNGVGLMFTNNSGLHDKLNDYKHGVEENFAVIQTLKQNDDRDVLILKDQLVEKISWYQLEMAKLKQRIEEPQLLTMTKRFFQIGFLVYCVYRLITTLLVRIPRILFHVIKYPSDYDYEFFLGNEENDSGPGDPLTVTLANILDFVIFRFKQEEELDSLIRQLSLILSISFFICSLSTVTTTISYLLTLLPLKIQKFALTTLNENEGSSLPVHNNVKKKPLYQNPPSILKNLVVSELTGVYILSTILMIRSNLPFDLSKKLNELLGKKFTVPNIAIDIWFDEIFASSSVLTLIGILIVDYIRKSK